MGFRDWRFYPNTSLGGEGVDCPTRILADANNAEIFGSVGIFNHL
jgi:hypothetical protein